MSIMNLLTLALVTLIMTLPSGQVANGVSVDCDYHFWPSDKDPTRGSCISQVDLNTDHSCAVDSCYTKDHVLWSALAFLHCHHRGRRKPHLSVLQYFRRKKFVSAQDHDGEWWDCNFSADSDNDNYLTCSNCD
ncbi:hypothetical protein KEM48_007981 [Puccinia striiformis f. sp. tritici PST-130]|nr:hypothetical protein H4Q26_008138 [Puccinia striiformis f. sp. tritici PST-130]KAI9620632.1 hypothetical protein KEM48_007981 [Puccinia striiformis f. sp. tritici PST-130]